MSAHLLPSLEIGAAAADADLCVILMHGLGADGNDFADMAAALCQASKPQQWRFVLPTARTQPVTINMGMPMPAWYDILDMSHPRAVNWDTVADSQQEIEALLACEPAAKLVLAGFSQGAAMALHVGLRQPESIAGILMMSGYLLESDQHPCPDKSSDIPIALLHGREDPVVPLVAAEQSVAALTNAGFSPSLNVYPGMEHSVCDEEIRDVYQWLTQL